jgi:D-3-phosphoglycerate dehydrogenase
LTRIILNLRIEGKAPAAPEIQVRRTFPARDDRVFEVQAVITDHHYHDIDNALVVLRDAAIVCAVGQCHTEDEAIEFGRDADAVINQHVPLGARAFDAWPRCRAVVHFGKGVDNIDVDAATKRGIWVANVRDANGDEVSNHVLAMVLAFARDLLRFDRAVRDGSWSYRSAVPRQRLAGQVLGLIGFGSIAQLVSAKARGIGLEVIVHARRALSAPGVSFVHLDELLGRSDFVSIHVPLTTSTRSMIGPRELALMKPTAFLINTARGGIVDQKALVEALQQRRIAGAGLDVTDPEPPARDDPLLALDNVILTPHVAWYSEESRERVTVGAAREVVRILRGDAPLSPVNPNVVPKRARDTGRVST